jgi:hypothetical protein
MTILRSFAMGKHGCICDAKDDDVHVAVECPSGIPFGGALATMFLDHENGESIRCIVRLPSEIKFTADSDNL